jgi:hypothetical protein
VLGPHICGGFASDTLDVYAVSDYMSKKGWGLSGLHRPACVHISLTLRHAQPGVVERLIADLNEAVEYVKAHPEMEGSLGPVYGMSGNIHLKGSVTDFLKQILDVGYTV